LAQSLELYRETIANLMELQMANNSNRMNSVMKTLTVISTIFIPLTFLAGIYGMNFEYMPELSIPWAYPALLIFMFVTGVGMFVYMKMRKWF
jgi:magnesium transporter